MPFVPRGLRFWSIARDIVFTQRVRDPAPRVPRCGMKAGWAVAALLTALWVPGVLYGQALPAGVFTPPPPAPINSPAFSLPGPPPRPTSHPPTVTFIRCRMRYVDPP